MGAFVPQQSFNGGEIAPQFYDRTDLDLYRSSVKRMDNWFPMPAGGIETRPFLSTVTGYNDFTFGYNIGPTVPGGWEAIDTTSSLIVREVNGGTVWLYFSWLRKTADHTVRSLRVTYGTLERWDPSTHGSAFQAKKDGEQVLIITVDTDTSAFGSSLDETLSRNISTSTVGPAIFVTSRFFEPVRFFATVSGGTVTNNYQPIQFYSELIGTVAVETGSPTVTGTDTIFVAQLAAGNTVKIEGVTYTVSAVASATSLTLNTNYTGLKVAGVRMDKAITNDIAFGTDQHPRLVTFFRSRLFFFTTIEKPTGMWASRSGDPFTIIPGGVHDAAPIEVELLAPGIDSFVWVLSSNQLVLGSSRGEYSIDATDSGPITPTNFSIAQAGSEGGSPVQPILLRTGVIFVSRSGTRLFYSHFDFSRQGIVSRDLGVFAPHLLTDRIDSISYRPPVKGDPAHRVFVLLKDQTLQVLEFDENHGILAWHRFGWDAGQAAYLNHVTSLSSAANTQFMSLTRGNYATIGYFVENRGAFFDQPQWTSDTPQSLTYDLIEKLPNLNATQTTNTTLFKNHPSVAVFSTYEGPLGYVYVHGDGTFTLPQAVSQGELYIGIAYRSECTLLSPVASTPQGPLVSRIRRKIRIRIHYHNTAQLTINAIPELGSVPAAFTSTLRDGIIEQRHIGWPTNVEDNDTIVAPGTYIASILSLTREIGF